MHGDSHNNMAIIAFLGNSVNEYIDRYQTLLGSMEFFCEKHPEQRLAYHGTYTRTVKDAEVEIPIQRLICCKCKKAKMGGSVSVLPDFLKPRRQFTNEAVESVAEQSKAGKNPYEMDTKASISTIRRWLRETSTQDEQHPVNDPCIITIVPPGNLSEELPSAILSLSPASDVRKVSTWAISITACG
jgi:hypothetical protein